MAQLQMELFLVTLYDFMTRRGSPITSPPVINGKKVNFFLLYVMSQKLGGPQALIKALQKLGSGQSPWTAMAYKLGLYEGLTDPNAKGRVDKELGGCYVQYLIPFEQHNSTPAGHKEIQERR
ncbi:ARID-like protein, partial [Yamadazyma tenuis ATCC 10573]